MILLEDLISRAQELQSSSRANEVSGNPQAELIEKVIRYFSEQIKALDEKKLDRGETIDCGTID